MRGLDPRIHLLAKKMDCRDKPGNDAASGACSYFSSAILLRSVPMLEISISSTSPAFIHTGGFCLAPMPSGVPVAMMSPGDSGVNTEQNSMIAGIEWISMSVPERCISLPFRRVTSVSLVGSGISSAVTIQGPSGPEPTKFLLAASEYLVKSRTVASQKQV